MNDPTKPEPSTLKNFNEHCLHSYECASKCCSKPNPDSDTENICFLIDCIEDSWRDSFSFQIAIEIVVFIVIILVFHFAMRN